MTQVLPPIDDDFQPHHEHWLKTFWRERPGWFLVWILVMLLGGTAWGAPTGLYLRGKIYPPKPTPTVVTTPSPSPTRTHHRRRSQVPQPTYAPRPTYQPTHRPTPSHSVSSRPSHTTEPTPSHSKTSAPPICIPSPCDSTPPKKPKSPAAEG